MSYLIKSRSGRYCVIAEMVGFRPYMSARTAMKRNASASDLFSLGWPGPAWSRGDHDISEHMLLGCFFHLNRRKRGAGQDAPPAHAPHPPYRPATRCVSRTQTAVSALPQQRPWVIATSIFGSFFIGSPAARRRSYRGCVRRTPASGPFRAPLGTSLSRRSFKTDPCEKSRCRRSGKPDETETSTSQGFETASHTPRPEPKISQAR